jgi:hypothetical protein
MLAICCLLATTSHRRDPRAWEPTLLCRGKATAVMGVGFRVVGCLPAAGAGARASQAACLGRWQRLAMALSERAKEQNNACPYDEERTVGDGGEQGIAAQDDGLDEPV